MHKGIVVDVSINVYDIVLKLNQRGADCLGLGIYHTAIAFNDWEYSFSGDAHIQSSGVTKYPARCNRSFKFKTNIHMGDIDPKIF